MILSDKRVIEPASIPKTNKKGYDCKQDGKSKCQIVIAFKGLGRVPGPFLMLAESAQLHGIADHINPLHTGEDKRENDCRYAFDSIGQRCLSGHLNSPGLLRMLNLSKIILYIGYIAKRDGNSIADIIMDSDFIHGSGKLTWICCYDKHKDRRNNSQIF